MVMHTDPVLVIINPLSGPGRRDAEGRARQRAGVARQALNDVGVEGRVEITGHANHAFELAAAAASAGVPRVVVWGGDGTLNEAARALAFGPSALGIVPGGSGNGLARALGISLKPAIALREALAGTVRSIDVGEISGRLFFNVAGIGLDALIASLFNRGAHRRGFSRYLGTGLVELFRYEMQRYVIETDRSPRLDQRALMIVLANGREYGNGARIAPHAELDDGLLDLVVVEGLSAWRNVLRVRYLFDGSIERRPGFRVERVARATIVNGAGPVTIHVDGESHQHAGELHARVHPGALHVIAPPSAAGH